jgi:hypothetical protein
VVVDYRKLAEEFGGRAESQPQEAPSIDYGALAEQFGGAAEEVEPTAPVAKGKSVSTTPEPSPDEPISVGQYASDYGKLFTAPAIQGVADLPQGLLDAAIAVPRAFATGEAYERGPLIPRALDKSVQLIRSLFGTSLSKQQEERLAGKIATDEFITEAKSLFELPRFFEYLSEEGGDVADKLRKSVSSRTKQKIEGSTPKGNFLEAAKTGDFSKLSFGDDPTLEGYAAHTVQVLGSLAPVIATAAITKGAPTPSAVVGGGMAGGEGAGEAREYVKSLSDGQLMEMSSYYANMRTAGIDEQKARKIISDRAAEQAAFLQGSVGALGGVFTGKLVTGKLDNYFTSNIRSRLGRIVALGGVGAAEEGTQEFLEGIAADVGIDKEVVKEIGAESFANLILGSLGGGAVGAGRGLVSPTPAGGKSNTEEDKAIADLDKLNAEELELEESILARADEIVEEFIGAGQTISMDDAYARARFEIVEDKPETGGVDLGLADEKDLFAEETTKNEQLQKAIAELPEEAQATPLESKQLIDKTLKKKLGRPPTDIETLEALYEFTQEKTNRLRAESGGREPTVPVLSGEEAVSRVTGAPERVEPTGLGGAVEPTDVSGARKEPTLGAVKPEDLELDAATAIETTAKAKEPTLGAVKPEDQINTAKKMMADLAKQPLNVENVAGREIVGDVKKYKGFKIYKVKEGYSTHWRAQSPENQALNKIGKGDSYHESLELAKDAVGDNLNDKFDAETFARRLLPKLTEGKATPTAPEPTRVRTVEDLSPEDKAAFDSETAEIRASMKEATDAAKERGLPFTNAAAPFVDQLRALDQSYGIGKPISEKRTVAQLAAELGGTADEDSGFRPAKDEEEEEFGERQGELKSDKAQMLRILSGSMYGSGIQDVAVKELLQNAFDSVKEAVHKGVIKGFGKINITFDEEKRRIIVTDNGMGMTTKIVDEGFFTVGGTKKDVPPELRSGGYGIAKVAFMTSTEEISLDTVRDGVRNIVKNATPVQITEGDFKIKKEPAPKDEHGTTVVVDIPSTYVDRSGKEQRIYFFSESSYISPLKKPLIGPVEVTVTSIDTDGSSSTETLPVGINFDLKSTPLLTKVNFEWGSADIYYGVERKDSPNHIVLSSGVYQFDGTGRSYNFVLGPGEIIPYDIIINVKPNVDASSSDYPFTLEREKFRDSHKQDIEALTRYLAQVARGAEAEGLQDTFKNIISMPKVYVGGINPDTEEKLRKLFNKTGKRPEFKPFETPKEINVGAGKVTTTKGVVLIDTDKKSEREKEKTFAAEKEAPKMEQFMNQMGQDPRQPIFHNNTNIDYIAIGEPYGDPQAFFAQLGSLFIDMKETVANGMYRYAKLKLPNLVFTGISIDKTYGGLNIIVPFKGSMINPFYVNFGETTLTGARERILDTMIHELAHTDERAHGVGHNSEMMKIKIFLSDSGKYDVYRDKLLELLVKHESTFSAMKEAYDRSTTKNAAKSLEDYNKATPSRADGVDVGVSKDTLRTLSAREGPGGDGDLRSASESDRGVTVGAGISESDADAELEQLATQLNLKVGDIHPTMVSAIANNDLNGALLIASQKLSGFSAELAKTLLALNLPTNISFNSGRDLVRRSIDNVSAQQQKRLFRYVEIHYPQVYDKYFKNYDTAPGAYYPRFDEIALDTNTRTGKSYRVFLHEVVHAATEYVLNTYGTNPQELTPGQREAVEELTKMYNYAVEKLGKEPYGMTNIYEFISEVFTNRKFQNLLKDVKYEPKKAPFLSRLIKSILNAFGLDNLAGNAMAEATKIFSAVRTGAPLAAQPRFAGGKRGKRVQGPISSPQTSRTQEQSTQSYIGTANLALKGRITWSKALKIMGDSFWDARNTQLRQVVLGFLNLSHLAEITQDKFPQIIGTIRLIEKMIEYRLSILNEAADISRRWTVAQFRSPRQSQLMSRIMLEASMRSLDPDDPKGQPVNAALLQAWATLKPEFKQIYRDVRNFYKKSVERMIKELEDRVNNSSLSQQEKEKALAEIAAQFGPDKLISPYFPLRRFGEFFFQVGSGNFKEFYEHESSDARNLAMNNRIEELSKGNAQQRALVASVYPGNGVSEIFSNNRGAEGVLKEVQNLVDSIGNIPTPPTKAQYDAAEKALQKELNRTPTKEEVEKRFERDEIKKELKDNINQLLYILLPQKSMRKMFINRKNIQGASEDMLRVFSTSAIHSAYQQSRFKFSDKLHNNITNALDDIRNNPLLSRSEKEVYRDFVIELEKRMPTILSAEDTSFAAKVAGRLSETTFFFMLSAPFSAMLNTIGMAQIALPYIGGTYGYDRTAKLMTKNMLRYTSTIPTRTIKPLAKGDFFRS